MRFVFFLFFALGAILLFRSGASSFFEKIGIDIELTVFRLFLSQPDANKFQKVFEENEDLRQKLVNLESIKKENKALKDQFQTGSLLSNILLPARIIGAPSFIPGITEPQIFILDKGKDDRVKKGQAVVFKNNLVGTITEVSKNRSKVQLLTHKDFSLSGRTMETSALGIINGGQNNELVFGNVLLSEELKISDMVLTYGEPSDIVIGKIVSVERIPSSLFQTARVKSLLAFSKLFMVFVIIGIK